MLSTDHLQQVKDALPGFNHASPRTVSTIQAEGIWGESPAGIVLFRTTEDFNTCLLLLEGRIQVTLRSDEGRELVLFRTQTCDPCALTSSCLLGENALPAHVETETECKFVKLPLSVFLQLFGESDEFRRFVLNSFASRISDLITTLGSFAFCKLENRLASVLLHLGDDIHTSHSTLAAEVGSVREVVSRTLKSFQEKGLVRLSRNRIEIINRPCLQTLADGAVSVHSSTSL